MANEVLERLRAYGMVSVVGNHDDDTGFDRDECGRAYVDPIERRLGDRSFEWTKALTTDAN